MGAPVARVRDELSRWDLAVADDPAAPGRGSDCGRSWHARIVTDPGRDLNTPRVLDPEAHGRLGDPTPVGARWDTDTVAADAELKPETASYPSGVLKFSGFRLAGEPHGAWQWYRADASLMRTGEFDRGRQVGTWQTFDRTGRLVKQARFPGK